MATAFIQTDKYTGLTVNSDLQKAADGFRILGYKVLPFTQIDETFAIKGQCSPVIGTIDTMSELFNLLRVDIPNFDYVENIGRNIYKTTVDKFILTFDGTPKFIKPIKNKIFDGIVIGSYENLNYIKFAKGEEIYVSDVLDIDSEWRFYVHYGNTLNWSHMKGNIFNLPSFTTVKKIISSIKNPPVSYTVDVAKLHDNSTVLVELNDFYAIGSYGLDCETYSKMLEQRYFEILKNN